MKKDISASTLFHFTKDYDTLISILANYFYPRYCLEDYSFISPTNRIGIPMVCFCDIPLSQILNHTERYGCYGIGLSKEWAIRKGINPVMYFQDKSLPSKCVHSLINHLNVIKDGKITINENNNFALNMNCLIRFFKPYEGNDTNNQITYYNEREWRYIPDLENLHNNKLPLIIGENEYIQKKDKANDDLQKISQLDFNLDDIKYIIIKDESEIFDIVKKLEDIKSKNSYREVIKLTTRIITHEQIRLDF